MNVSTYMGGFLKCWVSRTGPWVFGVPSLKMISTWGVKWGNPPLKETPIYRLNPNGAPCFTWKLRLVLRAWNFKNRGHWGSRYQVGNSQNTCFNICSPWFLQATPVETHIFFKNAFGIFPKFQNEKKQKLWNHHLHLHPKNITFRIETTKHHRLQIQKCTMRKKLVNQKFHQGSWRCSGFLMGA